MPTKVAQLPEHFKRFYREISLNATRAARIDAARDRIFEELQEDSRLGQLLVARPFVQGSFALGTVVRPLSDSGYDLDLVAPMEFTRFDKNFRTPQGILEHVQSRLRTRYGTTVRLRDKCVR